LIDAVRPAARYAATTDATIAEMEKRAREAAVQVAVVDGVDFDDRPTYQITFLFDWDCSAMRQGLFVACVSQRLRDQLTARD
jgi:hypothetical protein